MSRKHLFRWMAVFVVAAAVPVATQSRVNIKLGSLVPENSPWANALKGMGAAWSKTTGNRVRIQPYFNVFPSESAIIGRMALNNLQMATLQAGGLAEIDEAFNVFGIPFFFQSDEELAAVQQALTPIIERRLAVKKFRLVHWGNAGWVQVFSKEAIRNLDDLKHAKLYTGDGTPKMVQWYTSNGFHVVPLPAAEIPKQLKLPTGAIDAAPSPPVLALTLQFFRDAPYMLDVRVAPLTGATIVTEAAWNKISPADRTAMLDTAKQVEAQIQKDAPGLDAKAVTEMKGAGLQVIALDEGVLAEFRRVAESLLSSQRGNMVPADVFDAAVNARDVYRAAHGGR